MAITRKRSKVQPNVVLTFISANRDFLPTVPNYGGFSLQEDIDRARLALSHNPKKIKTYADLAKKQAVPAISESVLVGLLRDSTQKKYRERASPPFSASKLCGASLKGNDGALYTSTKNKAGACTWVKA